MIEECTKPAPRTLPLFLCTLFRDLPWAIRDHPGLNIDLRTPAVPPRGHMVLLGKDSLVMCSAQKTPTHISVYPSIHTAATKLIGDDRHKYPHSPEKVAPWRSPPATYHTCATLHTLLWLELCQRGWGKVRSNTQVVHRWAHAQPLCAPFSPALLFPLAQH